MTMMKRFALALTLISILFTSGSLLKVRAGSGFDNSVFVTKLTLGRRLESNSVRKSAKLGLREGRDSSRRLATTENTGKSSWVRKVFGL